MIRHYSVTSQVAAHLPKNGIQDGGAGGGFPSEVALLRVVEDCPSVLMLDASP